ncbi:MAG: hypothetical protein K5853_02490 [Lachnospiraceae bacterium]|nr:hypothetical protein [Lachnospiraceae bacterium]
MKRHHLAKSLFMILLSMVLVLTGCAFPIWEQAASTTYAATKKVDVSKLSNWSKLGNNYYYKKMTSAEKKFYKSLMVVCQEFLTDADVDAAKDKGRVEQPNGTEKLEVVYFTPFIPATGLSYSAASRVITVFCYSNPQYYFLDNGHLYSTGYSSSNSTDYALTVYKAFAKGSSRMKHTKKLQSVLKRWTKKINKQDGQIEKLRMAQDLVCGRVTYGKSKYSQSAYSVFCGSKSVCAGYSSAFSMLSQVAGINCINVTSEVVNNGTDYSHQWNMVKLNGHWYNVDVTWDDLDGQNYGGNTVCYYYYFLRDDQNFIYDLNYQQKTDSAYDSYYSHYAQEEFTHYGVPKANYDTNPAYPYTSPGAI